MDIETSINFKSGTFGDIKTYNCEEFIELVIDHIHSHSTTTAAEVDSLYLDLANKCSQSSRAIELLSGPMDGSVMWNLFGASRIATYSTSIDAIQRFWSVIQDLSTTELLPEIVDLVEQYILYTFFIELCIANLLGKRYNSYSCKKVYAFTRDADGLPKITAVFEEPSRHDKIGLTISYYEFGIWQELNNNKLSLLDSRVFVDVYKTGGPVQPTIMKLIKELNKDYLSQIIV